MNKLTKTFFTALIAALITNTSVLAEPSSNGANKYQADIDSLEAKIETMDNQIETTMKKVNENQKQIDVTKNDIVKLENTINETQKNIDSRQVLLDKRIRSEYITGVDGYIDVLLNSKDLNEFLSNAQVVSSIITFDNNAIDDMLANKKKIKNTSDLLKHKNNRLLTLKTENEKTLSNLNAQKEDEKKVLADTKEKQKAYAIQYAAEQAKLQAQIKAELEEKAREEVAKQEEIKKANLGTVKILASNSSSANDKTSNTATSESTPAPVQNSSSGNVSGSGVVSYAMNFLGTSYVWGGTTPNPGFDCSGYMQYVYAHFGVSIGRTTFDQINDGVEVSKNNLQPGDLVFFGTWDNPHHVGMYVGNNCYIHAPHTGDAIKISELSRSDFLTARRVR